MCHRQPLPPDTAQHCAALHTFIAVAFQMAMDECCGSLASVLSKPEHRAAHLVGYLHRQEWPKPGAACLSLQKADFADSAVKAAQVLQLQPSSKPFSPSIPAVVLASGLAKPLAEATMTSAPGSEACNAAWQVLCQVWDGVHELHAGTAGLHKALPVPQNGEELAQRLLQLCANLQQCEAERRQQQQQQQQQQGSEQQLQQPQPPQGPTQVIWVHMEDVIAKKAAAKAAAAPSASNCGDAACATSGATATCTLKLCDCPKCTASRGEWPAAYKVLALQLESLGLALLHRFAVECCDIGGAVWQRCPEQLAQLCMAHKAALGAARLDAVLVPPMLSASGQSTQQQGLGMPVLPQQGQQQQQQELQQESQQQQEPQQQLQLQQQRSHEALNKRSPRQHWRQRRSSQQGALPTGNGKALAAKVRHPLAHDHGLYLDAAG